MEITQSNLKSKRGWTDSLIKTFLANPDSTAPNTFHKNGAPFKLYSLSKVQAIEQSTVFQLALEKVEARRAGRKKKRNPNSEIKPDDNTDEG